LEETPDLDSTAADEILEFAEKIKVRGQTLILARVKDEVREILDKVAAPAIPSFTLTRSVNDAAILARKQLGQKPASSE
jgi:anti-anti-sigma regulatory factor